MPPGRPPAVPLAVTRQAAHPILAMAASMIEFRTLGTVDLRSADGGELRSILTQPKRLALLAYLCIARPHGFHRRDTLVALFWPDSDDAHARAALRKALHHLRRSLGPRVLVNRGMNEVGVRPGSLRCDAAAFDAAMDADEPGTALELFRGDLLEGFYVSDAPGFERWLEAERDRLRATASRAAWAVAEDRARRGETVGAVSAARRAAALAPVDEAMLRRVMAFLEGVGDVAGAINAYESFARRLIGEYEIEPSPQTRAVVDALRGRDGAPVVERPPARAAGAPEGAAFDSVPPTGERVTRAAPVDAEAAGASAPPGRWWLGATIALAILAVLATGTVMSRSDQAGSSAVQDRIAVLPFAVRTSGEFAYLGAGIADLLAMRIDGVGPYRTVDPNAIAAFARTRDVPAPGRALGQEVADTFNAGRFVLGTVVEAGGRLRISAALYGRDGDGRPLARTVVEGAAVDVFTLVDRLAAELLGARATDPDERIDRVAQMTTRSFAALQAYLEAEGLFRVGRAKAVLSPGRFADAVEAYGRAVAADSTFALAYYRQAVAAEWSFDAGTARAAGARAVRFADALPERYRLLIRGYHAYAEGRYAEAERLYRSLVSAYPDEIDGWYGLGEVLLHYNHMRGRPRPEARAAFERAVALEPAHWPALIHLFQLAQLEQALGRRDSLLARIHVDDVPAAHNAAGAIFRGDSTAREQALRALNEAHPFQTDFAFAMLAADYLVFDQAEQILDLLAGRGPEMRVRATMHRGMLRLAAGRVQEARAIFESTRAARPSTSLKWLALTTVLPFLPEDRTALLHARERLLRWDAGRGPEPHIGPGWSVPADADSDVQIRRYLLGLIAARLGEYDRALEHARVLAASTDPPEPRALSRDLALGVRATIAWRERRFAEALDLLEDAGMELPLERGSSLFYTRAHERYLRGLLLARLGRHEEALGWLESFRLGSDVLDHVIFLAPAAYEAARSYQTIGRPEAAAAHYRTALALWTNPDPPFRAAVANAERSITHMDRGTTTRMGGS